MTRTVFGSFSPFHGKAASRSLALGQRSLIVQMARVIRQYGQTRQESARRSRPLSSNHAPLMFSKRLTARLIEYAANVFSRDQTTFVNESADLSEKVWRRRGGRPGIGLDNRIGTKFLHAGPASGGLQLSEGNDVQLRILETVRQRQPQSREKVSRDVGRTLRGKAVAVFSLTFTPSGR